MIPLRDCLGRIACMGDPTTGLVECIYKGHKTSTVLKTGETFRIERQEVITIITRSPSGEFKVSSSKEAA